MINLTIKECILIHELKKIHNPDGYCCDDESIVFTTSSFCDSTGQPINQVRGIIRSLISKDIISYQFTECNQRYFFYKIGSEIEKLS